MSGYPVILNGDHAEYEAMHANTPPKERSDWPLPSFDAKDWAEAFCKIANGFGFKDSEGKPIDEDWMITWFANALMRGYDECSSKEDGQKETAIEIVKILANTPISEWRSKQKLYDELAEFRV